MRSPKAFGVSNEIVVVGIAWMGFFEWYSSGEECEKNDSRSKQVNRLSIVHLSKVDLRSHVASSSKLSTKHTIAVGALN